MLSDAEPGLALAIACARGDAAAVCSLARATTDWPSAVAAIREHQVECLACEAISAHTDAVPEGALRMLRDASARAARNSILLAGELLRLVRLFEDKGIEVIPLRGPVLAELLYGRLDRRPCADLDLLVHAADVDRAESALVADGFRPERTLGPLRRRWLRSWGCESNFDRGGIHAEVHWRFFPAYMGFSLPEADLWDRAVSATFLGHRVLTLSAEDCIAMLCLHNGGKHLWWTLRWVLDLAMFFQDSRIDWTIVHRRAAEAGCLRALLVGLRMAEDLLDRPPPAPLRACLEADATASRVASKTNC